MSPTKTLTKQKSGRTSPLPDDPPRTPSKSPKPKSPRKSPSKRASDGGAIATAAVARSLAPKQRSSDGGAVATAAAGHSPKSVSRPKSLSSTGRSKSEGGKSKSAHARSSVPLSPKRASSSSPKPDPLEYKSAHVRSVPLLPLEETSEEWEGEEKKTKNKSIEETGKISFARAQQTKQQVFQDEESSCCFSPRR